MITLCHGHHELTARAACTASARVAMPGRPFFIATRIASGSLRNCAIIRRRTIRADAGLLPGPSSATADRIYWHSKFASMTSDLPTEARLTPNPWGQWRFEAQ